MAVSFLHICCNLDILCAMIPSNSTGHAVPFHSTQEEVKHCLGTVVIMGADRNDTARLPIDKAVDDNVEVDQAFWAGECLQNLTKLWVYRPC